jgi:beta-galactosidase
MSASPSPRCRAATRTGDVDEVIRCWTRVGDWTPGKPFRTIANPGYYHGGFTLDFTGDTFLDLRGWGKGTVWVNGHQLGRFWGIGPEQTLYVPGPWLHVGRNEVVVFDLLAPERPTLQGLDHPILDDLRPDDRSH